MAGMPMPPEGAPAEAPQEGGAEGGGVTELIIGIDSGMSKLAALVGQAQGVPPGVAQKLQSAIQAYQAAVDELTGGGGAGGPEPAQGSAPMEAGGSSKAVPAPGY